MSCLGPYQISSNLSKDGNTFVDPTKSLLISTVTPTGQIPSLPTADAIILHEVTNYQSRGYDVHWYECPHTLGRKYTILPTACEIFITSFVNGLTKTENYDQTIYGTSLFCYGKTYNNEQIFNGVECQSIFDFDGNSFAVQGHSSNFNDLFSCESCADAALSLFESKGELPETPPEFTTSSDAIINNHIVSSQKEEVTQWGTDPTEKINDFISCTSENTLSPANCESQQQASIARLTSGHMIVAYESNDEHGFSKIKLSILKTTIEHTIFYYRETNFGRLINDNSYIYGNASFEIYDDIVPDLDENNVPTSSLFLGFLNGPLKGIEVFSIIRIERIIQDDQRPKHIIQFNTNNRIPEFINSNDAYNVQFFILSSSDNLPDASHLDELLTLPDHFDENGKIAPVTNPSVATAENHITVDGSIYIYVTYQVFENSQWNIYLRQIRLNDNEPYDPLYTAPYSFNAPQIDSINLNNTTISETTYRVANISNTDQTTCVLFEIFLLDGRQIQNCDGSDTTYIHTCGSQSNNKIASLEATYVKLGCDMSELETGDEFTSTYPPNLTNFLADSISTDCLDNISINPSTANWCYLDSTCNQFYVQDDPYCPIPYITFVYKPTDLWQLKVNDDKIITRVKYNLSVAAFESEDTDFNTSTQTNIDFMFVVDFSGSMGDNISNVRTSISKFAQDLIGNGVNARFGLTIYGRNNTGDPHAIACSGCWPGSDIFNGLWDSSDTGFTNDILILQNALSIASDGEGPEPGYSAISYALNHEQFQWRSNAKRIIFLITDTTDESGTSDDYPNSQSLAISYIQQFNAGIGIAISNLGSPDGCGCQPPDCRGSGEGYLPLLENTDLSLGSFDVNGPYDDIFNSITTQISNNISVNLINSRVIERDIPGYGATFLKNAEIILTYNQDLLDIWTNEKQKLVFNDNAPQSNGSTKGLTNYPYDLTTEQIFSIDPVHINGNLENWVYFSGPGPLNYQYPEIGYTDRSQSTPILIAKNAIQPRIKTNYNNEIFILYESLHNNQIIIQGTGDFAQNSLIGAKSNRITRFFKDTDFAWQYPITSSSDGINQSADLVIDRNNIVHVTWQSNRNHFWEIYYAQGYDLFTPIRITQSQSRSSFPKISLDHTGSVYVVYQDNRFKTYEILLDLKQENRVLPLVQQDAYLASLRNLYNHYTNILPIHITNSTVLTPLPGLIWASKTASDSGNNNESFLFAIPNPEENELDKECQTDPKEFIALAGARSGNFYGITNENELLLLQSFSQNKDLNINCNDFSLIGIIDLPSNENLTTILSDEFNQSNGSSPNSLIWTPKSLFFGVDYANVPPQYIPIDWNGTQCNGLLTSCGDCTICNLPGGSITQGGGYAIITRDIISARSVRIQSSLKWDSVGATQSPPYYFILRNQTQDFPYFCIRLNQECENDICSSYALRIAIVRVLTVRLDETFVVTQEITEAQTVISSYAPFYNQYTSVQIDCTETDATLTGLKNLNIYVYIENDLKFSYTFENLSSSDNGMGNYYGIGTYSIINPSASINFGTFKTDYIRFIDINPTTIIDSKILDASCDASNRLWVILGDQQFNGQLNLRIAQINTSNAAIIRDTTVYSDINERIGGLSISNTNKFFIDSFRNNSVILSSSDYPIINNENLDFTFNDINRLTSNIKSTFFDYQDVLYGLADDNKLYQIDSNGTLTFLIDLTTASGDPYLDVDPIGTVKTIGYQFSGLFDQAGTDGFFHIKLDFYDNLNLDGSAIIQIDSRSNLESFINTTEDAYFTNANGIFIPAGQSATIWFDASHIRPGITPLSYPYGFATNQTYFPKVTLILPDETMISSTQHQSSSFSCNRCSTLSNNNLDQHDCSISFTITDAGTFNFLVKIYSDPEYTELVQKYQATFNHRDLQFFEVNNQSATNAWEENGLVINTDTFVQLYPTLDEDSGLLCGINYYVQIYQCKNTTCNNMVLLSTTTFTCECSNTLFPDNMHNLSSLPRWYSSNYGYADTRISDAPENNIKPVIKVRDSNGAIILYERVQPNNTKNIRGAIFYKNTPNQLYGSGSKSWFDYDFNIEGQNPLIELDLYNRPFILYEKNSNSPILPTTLLAYKKCNFILESETNTQKDEICDITPLLNNVITTDSHLLSALIKKIHIAPNYVDYYTYNTEQQVVPVVSKCEIKLEVFGTPESVAIRFRNDNQNAFSNWCSFNEINDYYIEIPWSLSFESGIKRICGQIITYNGITAEFCLPVIADYNAPQFEINLYADQEYNNRISTYKNLYVAATQLDASTATANTTKTIYVEIIPLENINTDYINFNVLQQGSEDQYNLIATKFVSETNRISFRGSFNIFKDDHIFNKDGSARIQPKLPGDCFSKVFVSKQIGFTKDKFNIFAQDSQIPETDSLAEYRQEVSGQIGTGIIIRPMQEDPYFIFGLPNYFLNRGSE